MPLIQTGDIAPDSAWAPGAQHQTYCGLDCCVTLEVLGAIRGQLDGRPNAARIYGFEKALQAPYLAIMERGFRVDEHGRRRAAEALRGRISALQQTLNTLAEAVWDKGLNPRSPKQLAEFLYGACRLPEVHISQKGIRRLSTNREALEKLDSYIHTRPIISAILLIRDLGKQLQVFEQEIDSDGRFRASYNIAGTECISGDSLIWTKGGLRRIDEIYKSPFPVQVWNGNSWVYPARKVCYPGAKGIKLTLENGYSLRCTLNHEVMTENGWVQAQNLHLGNRVELTIGLGEFSGQHAMPRGGSISQMSEDFCEFYGMILADGSLDLTNGHYRCRLSNSNQSIRQRFLHLACKVFGAEGSQTKDEAWFSSKLACQELALIGFPANKGLGTAKRKSIPASLLRGTSNLLRALLRGLTLDSHITKKGLMYGTQSPDLQDQIQQILLLLGIVSVKLNQGSSIKLNIPRAYCGRFLSLVGFVDNRKLARLAVLLNERCQWHEPLPFGQTHLFPVTKIEPWEGDVYDLAMPDESPPRYVAHGITVHNTGRPSSSENAFGTGGNAQNIAPGLRHVFVADEGFKLCVIDLEQVEARDVGFFEGCLFDDWSFLDNCEGGDLHTLNAALIWPELGWTGEARADRALADQPFYRDFSYRDMAKRGSHLSNYSGSAWTMARSLKIPPKLAEDFQSRYCRGDSPAYPAHQRYWQWVATQLQTKGHLTTPFGRQRHFYGRPDDAATLREAIAFLPQSTTADRMNLALWRIWRHEPTAQLLAQTHDSVTFQAPDNAAFDPLVSRILTQHIPVILQSPAPLLRPYSVPGEAKIGYNWGYASPANPEGLLKWKPGADQRRRRTGLERVG